MSLPPGYIWSCGERIQRQDEQSQQMLVNDLLALLLVYIVMASQFESLAHPFAILVYITLRSLGRRLVSLGDRQPVQSHGANWRIGIDGHRR